MRRMHGGLKISIHWSHGDSNLGDFYTFDTDNFDLQQNFTWNSFDLRDFEREFQ